MYSIVARVLFNFFYLINLYKIGGGGAPNFHNLGNPKKKGRAMTCPKDFLFLFFF